MSSSPEEPILRRKRVLAACDTCRGMKSKCDGIHPSCGRCEGFGYKCAYSRSGRRRRGRQSQQVPDRATGSSSTASSALEDAITGYWNLFHSIAPSLPEPERTNALKNVESVRGRVEGALANAFPAGATWPLALPTKIPSDSQRYLGEVSDVSFFNLVKQVLQKNLPERADDGLDSYEQDDPVSSRPSPDGTASNMDSPSPEMADIYLEIYFSTIHLAYPFIPRRAFMNSLAKFRESGATEDVDSAWLATLYILFAIGAYYQSFPENDQNGLHEQYFLWALALSNTERSERSAHWVTFLLAQCFYLLAVCRTDRCWITLGLAIRAAQSIGLHVERDDAKTLGGQALLKAEMQRRLWYALYVLDRLLSLQLGRPPAIHDDDCHLPLPSGVDDRDIDWEGTGVQLLAPGVRSEGSYFLSVIDLSRIIGYVLRDLYSPRRGDRAANCLYNTKSLDKQLLDWKRNLPRALRFDFGHAFETSLGLRRQRNMLAVKFHHLRALIHRPYLCLSFLRNPGDTAAAFLQGDSYTVDRYEKICISEAQETAQLLHNITDKKELVHDFPWWQMIPCLICASSILVVASVFAQRPEFLNNEDLDVTALGDHAETCLKVFEALSAQSEGARIAREMMTRLKERSEKWNDSRVQPPVDESQLLLDDAGVEAPAGSTGPIPIPVPSFSQYPATEQHGPASGAFENAFFGAQEYPPEIIDSMAWSAQFFGTTLGGLGSGTE